MPDDYKARSYGAVQVGLGRKPGIVVVDFQRAFTDPKLPLGGAISGQVTDDSGDPTGNAEIDVFGRHGGVWVGVGVNPDGSYTVAGLATGTYHVCATWVPPFDSETGFAFGTGTIEECSGLEVAVTAGQTTTGVDRSVATGGSVTVSASASSSNTITGVQFLLDGQPLGGTVTTPPFQTTWNTATATNGSHTLAAKVTDSTGAVASSQPVTVTVTNGTAATLVAESQVFVDCKNTVTTPGLTTASPGDLLVAFVGADGPPALGQKDERT